MTIAIRKELVKLKSMFEAATAYAAVSECDCKFLAFDQVCHFLSVLRDDAQIMFALGWLAFVTGLSEKKGDHAPPRLTELTAGYNERPESFSGIYLDLTSHVLSYPVAGDPADKRKVSSSPTLVQLVLPASVVATIERLKTDKPFTGLDSRLYKLASEFRTKHGGITPTLLKLSNSYQLYIAPQLDDDIIATTLTGNIDSMFKAEAHYYQFDNTSLNTLWQAVVTQINEVIQNHPATSHQVKEALASMIYEGSAPSAVLGSLRHDPFEQLHDLTHHIITLAEDRCSLASYASGMDELTYYSEAANLQGAYHHLMQRYFHALRSVRVRAEIYYADSVPLGWVEDKNSRDFHERRLVPVPEVLRIQREYTEATLKRLQILAARHKLKIEYTSDTLKDDRAIHVCLKPGKANKPPVVQLSPFSEQAFRNTMDAFGIPYKAPGNINRHKLATTLCGEVPQLLLDQLLNHTRSGFDLFSPYSSASVTIKDFDQLGKQIEGHTRFHPIALPLRAVADAALQTAPFNQLLAKDRRAKKIKSSKKTKASKPARFSVLPDDHEPFVSLSPLTRLYDSLWLRLLADHGYEKFGLISITMSMNLDGGYDLPYISNLLARAKWEHLDGSGHLRVPMMEDDATSPLSYTALPHSTQLLLEALRLHDKCMPGCYIFQIKTYEVKERVKELEQRLTAQWQDLIALGGVGLSTLEQAFSAGRLNPLLQAGIEPFIITLHGSWPPPTMHAARHNPPLLRGELSQAGLTREQIENSQRSYRPRATQPVGDIEKPDAWKFTKKMLKILKSTLKAIASELNHGNSDTSLKSITATTRVHQLVDELLEAADQRFPDATSALHLALEWVRSEYTYEDYQNNLAASTVSNYISQAFTGHFLDIDFIDDLTQLSAEALRQHLLNWLDTTKCDPKTIGSEYDRLKEVIRFGVGHGYLTDLAYDVWVCAEESGTRRNDLIDLERLDHLIRQAMGSEKHHDQQQAIVLLLSHYAGLREAEIRLLKLDSIVCHDDSLWLYVRMGKSNNARRAIPLHRLVPEAFLTFLHTFVSARKAEFTGKKRACPTFLKSTYLLGDVGQQAGYSRHQLSDKVIDALKTVFGLDADLHLLRHGFASWLVLRFMALRYPEITENLVHRNHWMFSDKAQAKLRPFFQLKPGTPLKFESNSIIRIGKIMGHAGARTLFSNYVQTFHIVQRHAIERMNRVFGQRKLSGKLMKALFPGRLGSSATQAKVMDKTVSGVREFLMQPQKAE